MASPFFFFFEVSSYPLRETDSNFEVLLQNSSYLLQALESIHIFSEALSVLNLMLSTSYFLIVSNAIG